MDLSIDKNKSAAEGSGEKVDSYTSPSDRSNQCAPFIGSSSHIEKSGHLMSSVKEAQSDVTGSVFTTPGTSDLSLVIDKCDSTSLDQSIIDTSMASHIKANQHANMSESSLQNTNSNTAKNDGFGIQKQVENIATSVPGTRTDMKSPESSAESPLDLNKMVKIEKPLCTSSETNTFNHNSIVEGEVVGDEINMLPAHCLSSQTSVLSVSSSARSKNTEMDLSEVTFDSDDHLGARDKKPMQPEISHSSDDRKILVTDVDSGMGNFSDGKTEDFMDVDDGLVCSNRESKENCGSEAWESMSISIHRDENNGVGVQGKKDTKECYGHSEPVVMVLKIDGEKEYGEIELQEKEVEEDGDNIDVQKEVGHTDEDPTKTGKFLRTIECPLCNYKGRDVSNLIKHMNIHEKKKGFSCKVCGTVCATKQRLQSHRCLASEENPLECLVCGNRFKHIGALREHMLAHTTVKPVKCDMCDFVCKTKSQLEMHMDQHKDEGSFACTKCKFTFTTEVKLQQHLRAHNGEQPFQCQECLVAFWSNTELQDHLTTHNNTEAFVCEYCDFKCDRKQELNSHLLIHTDFNPFTCSLCEFSCRSKSVLIQHTLTHMNDDDADSEEISHAPTLRKTGSSPNDGTKDIGLRRSVRNRRKVKPSYCEMDGFEANKKAIEAKVADEERLNEEHFDDDSEDDSIELEDYMKIKRGDVKKHTIVYSKEDMENKPFACDQCEFRSKKKGDLNRHLLSHLPEKPYSCTMCSYSCTRRTRLEEHMCIHTNMKPFSCKVCTYRCRSKQSMYYHMEERHNGRKNRSLSCSHCDFKTLTRYALRNHMEHNHPGKRPFACSSCSYSCWLSSDLKRHEWIHKGIKPFECEECGYKCRRFGQLNDHKTVHNNTRAFKCGVCTHGCRTKRQLKRHMKVHEKEGVIEMMSAELKREKDRESAAKAQVNVTKSSELEQSLNQKEEDENEDNGSEGLDEVEDHIPIHFEKAKDNNAVRPSGDTCIKMADLVLKVHINEEGQREWPCPVCSYVCQKKSHLQMHMSRHTTERPYECDLCSYAAKTKKHLIAHIKRHPFEKALKRKEEDQSAADNTSEGSDEVQDDVPIQSEKDEDTSVVTSSGGRDSSEQTNTAEFVLKVRINEKGQREWPCPVCPKIWTKKSHLQKHMSCHTTERPYKCGVCAYAAKTNQHLIAHIKKRHEKYLKRKEEDQSADNTSEGSDEVQDDVSIQSEKDEDTSVVTSSGGRDSSEQTNTAEFVLKVRINEKGQREWPCPVCPKIWTKKSHLQKHMSCHTTERPYRCEVCSYAWKSKKSLIEHIKKHALGKHSKRKETDQSADNTSDESSEVGDDEKDKDTSVVTPSDGGVSAVQIDMAQLVLVNKKGRKEYHCPMCPYVCNNSSHLKMHMTCHSTERPFKCEHCAYASKTKKHLIQHLKRHSGCKPYTCKVCNYGCYELRELNEHLKTHSEIRAYKCSRCQFTAHNRYRLKIHMTSHSGYDQCKCPECGVSFQTRTRLKEHMFKHKTVKDIECPLCPFKCQRPRYLQKHMKIHRTERKDATESDLKPYLCTQCGASYKYCGSLSVHMTTHSNEKPWSCTHCSYRCRTKSSLQSHLIKHMESKPLQCEYCPFTCKHMCSLRRHRLGHINTEQIKCKMCDFTTLKECNLRRHLRKKHKIKSTEIPNETEVAVQQLEDDYNRPNRSSDGATNRMETDGQQIQFVDKQMEFDAGMEYVTAKTGDFYIVINP